MIKANRDTTLDILKGIGIILMVIGHSGCPQWIHNVIYSFHMPLFFIASGWFFNEESLDYKKNYTQKKFKGLYLPYLKWSIIFLLLHDVFFFLGIINSSYGYKGTVEKWYDVNDLFSHFVNITFRMTDYDGLIGTYWFMRSLFIGSLLFCFGSSIMRRITKRNTFASILITTGLFCALGGAISLLKMNIPLIPQGGYREMMAVSFIGIGYIMSKTIAWRSLKWVSLSFLIYLMCVILYPTALKTSPVILDWMVIVLSGITGTMVMLYICRLISKNKAVIGMALAYIGKRTFYIMTFHFLMFKPASYLKICMNNLEWQEIGYHPVIPPAGDYWFWIVYTVTSITFSLLLERILFSMLAPKLKMIKYNK